MDLLGVDDDDVVAHIDIRRVQGVGLAGENTGGAARRDGRGSGRWRRGRTTCAGCPCRWEWSLSDSDSRVTPYICRLRGTRREARRYCACVERTPQGDRPHAARLLRRLPWEGPELPKGARSLVKRWPGSRVSVPNSEPGGAGLGGEPRLNVLFRATSRLPQEGALRSQTQDCASLQNNRRLTRSQRFVRRFGSLPGWGFSAGGAAR